MTFAHQARTTFLMVLVLTVICGVLYPLVMSRVAVGLFPNQANGSLVRDAGGNVVGSTLIAQGFSKPEYFHPRSSAAGTNGYDPTSSGASNLGPTNPSLSDGVRSRADAYRAENGLADTTPLPADAVTQSASGTITVWIWRRMLQCTNAPWKNGAHAVAKRSLASWPWNAPIWRFLSVSGHREHAL